MSNVVRRAVEDASFVCDDDTIRAPGFDEDTGLATATLECDACLSPKQVARLEESDTWRLRSVHPAAGDRVDVYIIEEEA